MMHRSNIIGVTAKWPRGPRCFGACAFSLVELLLVISIIVILISLLLPSLRLSVGREMQCLSNMKQLGGALTLYAVANTRQLPFDNWRGVETSNPTTVPAGFLYDFKVRDPMAFGSRPQQEVINHVKTGTLYEYVGGTEMYRCPEDPRPKWTGSEPVRQMTSYPMNGAIGAYGRQAGNAFSIRAFKHDAVFFFEVDYSFWWDGSDFPNQGMAYRHDEKGNVANVDGSAEAMDFYTFDTLESAIPGRFWAVPGSGN